MYEIFKDFAGPVATIVAVLVAAGITWRFSSIQARIARTQSDIAFDKLKFDLFEKRYAIFDATKLLVKQVANIRDTDEMDSAKIADLNIKIDEARFFFDDEVRLFLEELSKHCENYLWTLAERERIDIDSDEAQWRALGEKLTTFSIEFQELYAQLPSKFEKALSFRQLTNKLHEL